MEKVKAIIERANDGSYSVYMDSDSTDYMITGTGQTAEEAIRLFRGGYEDTKRYYREEGKDFKEVEFEFCYDMPSFLQHFAYALTLAGLSRITGVNQGQLSHYINGVSKPGRKTIEKIQNGIHRFAGELASVKFS